MSQPSAQQIQQILSKFIINLPRQQLEDASRLSYHAQKAFYYYIDHLSKNKQINEWRKQRKDFFINLKEHAPSFIKIIPNQLNDKLLQSKSVSGAIVFNKCNSKVLVIKVKDKLGFPKGKINQSQTLEECAIRQVQEETGINIFNKVDPKIRIQFINHEVKIFFFIARGVSEHQRFKIDHKEIDEVFWMSITDIRKELNTKFSERSKLAWAWYEKEYSGKGTELYVSKYFKKDSEKINYQNDPLKHFKLDHQRLKDIIYRKNNVFYDPNAPTRIFDRS